MEDILHTGSKEEDVRALLALYRVTGGPDWINPWDLAAEVKTWRGVMLTSEGRVLSLSLCSNNLRGKRSLLLDTVYIEKHSVFHRLLSARPECAPSPVMI